jgi:hypothetical protein
MARLPFDPVELYYLVETGWHRTRCPLCRTLEAATLGGAFLKAESWVCGGCGQFELTHEAAFMLGRIRFEDPARCARLGRLIRRKLGELEEPINVGGILHAEADEPTDGLSSRTATGVAEVLVPIPVPDTATIPCPRCEYGTVLVMPTTYCQCMYECAGCGAPIDRKPGYCCVFCSYSDKTCPTRKAGWCHPPFESSMGLQKA